MDPIMGATLQSLFDRSFDFLSCHHGHLSISSAQHLRATLDTLTREYGAFSLHREAAGDNARPDPPPIRFERSLTAHRYIHPSIHNFTQNGGESVERKADTALGTQSNPNARCCITLTYKLSVEVFAQPPHAKILYESGESYTSAAPLETDMLAYGKRLAGQWEGVRRRMDECDQRRRRFGRGLETRVKKGVGSLKSSALSCSVIHIRQYPYIRNFNAKHKKDSTGLSPVVWLQPTAVVLVANHVAVSSQRRCFSMILEKRREKRRKED
ncbi:hypothetical protein L249_6100 [Ophiocordyceps polyrhachis-furcata BCC 54312]|uniref:Uncharacterized protein n=1 Tax=Ophiocordyceps polyrhachis-furcata BCC 54312 TaxID=1330021 RepID=A0A367LJ56_9HYPO|nr:hypothetical protein L249_6100 [Ophiocordyceps polyrhachis-furcata BCC 54312]